MQVISLYWLRAGYVRRLRCRRRRANAWWCRSSMRCACVGYKKQLSQGLFFAVFLILQSSEQRLFSKTVFFSNGRFGSCHLEPQTGASPVPPSLAIFFLQIGFPRNMWSGRQGLYLEDDGKEPLACSTPIEQQLAGQLFVLSDQPQNGTKRVPG
jgi:hypothetical protein